MDMIVPPTLLAVVVGMVASGVVVGVVVSDVVERGVEQYWEQSSNFSSTCPVLVQQGAPDISRH